MDGLLRWGPRVLLLLLCAHFATGAFPITPVEGDEQGVVNGLQAWARGTGDFNEAGYLYPIQPGSYHLLHCLHRLTHLPHLILFSWAGLVGTVVFVYFGSQLIAMMASVRPVWVALALLASQEVAASVAYANTNALAGGVTLAGLFAGTQARNWRGMILAGSLLGLGGWLRMDSLLLAPALLVLRWRQGSGRDAFRDTAQAAVAAIVVVILLFAVGGLSVTAAWDTFSQRTNIANWHALQVNGWLVLGYVPTLLCLIGLIHLCFLCRWSLAALTIVSTLLSVAVYGGSFSTPKYLYYATPFLLLPGILWMKYLFEEPARLKRSIGALALFGVALEAGIGVQTSSVDFRRYEPASPALSLLQMRVHAKDIRAGIGEGEIIPTDDGPRLRTGYFWAPQMWRREKKRMPEELVRIDRALSRPDTTLVIVSVYLSFRIVDGWLREHGYVSQSTRGIHPENPSSSIATWEGHGRHIEVALINHTPHDADEFSEVTARQGRILFVNDRGRIGAQFLTGGRGVWVPLSPRENCLVTLYERR